MAAGPLSRITLAAGSVADDLSYVALTGISRLLDDQTTDYRIIGGLMVTALAARWELGVELYRETLDADLGVPPLVARDLLDTVHRLDVLSNPDPRLRHIHYDWLDAAGRTQATHPQRTPGAQSSG